MVSVTSRKQGKIQKSKGERRNKNIEKHRTRKYQEREKKRLAKNERDKKREKVYELGKIPGK